jgi:hypothetical protein
VTSADPRAQQPPRPALPLPSISEPTRANLCDAPIYGLAGTQRLQLDLQLRRVEEKPERLTRPDHADEYSAKLAAALAVTRPTFNEELRATPICKAGPCLNRLGAGGEGPVCP